MKSAEFEEKEYESPLYHQLGRDPRIWSPGQVLENRIGFDHALYSAMNAVWIAHGLTRHLPGLALSRHPWFRSHFMPRRATWKPPSFRLNLFIQAKRPQWGTRPTAQVKRLGLTDGPYWKFELDDNQQKVLQRLDRKAGKKALIVYAAAVFHKKTHLYHHTRLGTVAENSTFPSARALTGHRAWYYQQPGSKGVAASTPTSHDEGPIFERIQREIDAVRETDTDQAWSDNLQILSQDIESVLEDGDLEETAARAEYFEAVRSFRGYDEVLPNPAERSFAEIAIFASVFDLDWYVLGNADI